ncbi:probable G-protein coupled receptor 139 [Scyliorhinus torazame]|uniref:probable G-protein coupled receptor 139 n=1 Tax=Scyliorhinus torazame TaxID=75743 RepID=UPI003B5C50C9
MDANREGARKLKLFGSVNLLGIIVLCRGKCGLSSCTTRYLVAMATADLLLIIADVILNQINYYYFLLCFLHLTVVCSAQSVLVCAARDCSVWFTVTFSFDRFVAICCQKLRTKYCTGKTAVVVLTTTGILLYLKNIPWYFTFEPYVIINNVPWLCNTKVNTLTDPTWLGFSWFEKVLTPLLPFALVLLLNALTVRYILVTSRIRQGLRGKSNEQNSSDPEMESRRKSIILLLAISGSFILLWLVNVGHFLYSKIRGIVNSTEFEVVVHYVGWMLRNLSCCTNTFIYVLTQSKFREQLKQALKSTVISTVQLVNKLTAVSNS